MNSYEIFCVKTYFEINSIQTIKFLFIKQFTLRHIGDAHINSMKHLFKLVYLKGKMYQSNPATIEDLKHQINHDIREIL